MKKLILGATALALLSGPVFAQNYDRDRVNGRDNNSRYDDRGRDNDRRDNDRGRDERRDTYRTGGTIPYEFRSGGHYAFYDWRGAGLKQPRGPQHWFKIGNQYLLADQHTGKIFEVRDVREQRITFREGGIVPYEYRAGGKFIYYNWRGAGLKPPPRGYQWMHIGDSFILADQQNGRITDVKSERGRDRR